MKLIDKDALVAEIESFREELQDKVETSDFIAGEVFIMNYFLSFLNTLEVKEVDLEKELIEWHKEHLKKDGTFIGMSGFYLTNNSQMDIAKHFYELGIKAQHDNWKVVDSINLPQADRNKIYCVLSKNKYLLARVISHPQDDDLLQWKCTEFPFHRYDMCEGDKYMQIV